MRVHFFVCVVMLGCGEPTWMANPCGNGQPVDVSCENEADVVFTEPSVEKCDALNVSVGDSCDISGDTCVLLQGYTCESSDLEQRETLLTCRSQPYDDVECPQSSRSVKRDIVYVDGAKRAVLAKEILDLKLATYEYTDPSKAGPRLGYILEDHPASSFSRTKRVDLYAYMSALVALTQQQQEQIDALTVEVRRLRQAEKP